MLSLEYYPHFEEKEYIVDGANICWIEKNQNGKPMLRNLTLLIKKLLNLGINIKQIYIFCDASLKHLIDNINNYQKLIDKKIIREAPAEVKADEFILAYCLNHDNALIISNDRFKEYKSLLPSRIWLKKRRISVMRIKNEILIVPLAENPHCKK